MTHDERAEGVDWISSTNGCVAPVLPMHVRRAVGSRRGLRHPTNSVAQWWDPKWCWTGSPGPAVHGCGAGGTPYEAAHDRTGWGRSRTGFRRLVHEVVPAPACSEARDSVRLACDAPATRRRSRSPSSRRKRPKRCDSSFPCRADAQAAAQTRLTSSAMNTTTRPRSPVGARPSPDRRAERSIAVSARRRAR